MSKLERIKYKDRKEFLEIRQSLDGFGGSDVATIMGLNQYKSKLEFFHAKIGMTSSVVKDNPAMYRGRVLEDYVVKYYWKYYDPENPTMDQLIENANNETKVRSCQKVNAIIRNPKYPWMFTSLDYKINEPKNPGALEIKTATGYASDKWEAGIDPSYVIQIMQQMIVTGMKWGEIALLKDATTLEVFRFEANEKIQQNIIEATKEFAMKVNVAKAILLSDQWSEEERMEEIQKLEPEPEATPAYEKYLKEHYKSENNQSIEGDDEAFLWAVNYKTAAATEKEWEENKRLHSNLLRKYLIDHNANIMTFKDHGKVFIQKDNKLNVKIYN